MSVDQELHRDRPGLRITLNKEVRPEKQQGNHTTSLSGFISIHWLATPVRAARLVFLIKLSLIKLEYTKPLYASREDTCHASFSSAAEH